MQGSSFGLSMESMAEQGGLKREGWKVLERGGRKLLKVGTEKVPVYGDYTSPGFCVDECCLTIPEKDAKGNEILYHHAR